MAKLTNKELEEQLEEALKKIELYKSNELVPEQELIEKLSKIEQENEKLKNEVLIAKETIVEARELATTDDVDPKPIEKFLNERVPFKAFKDDSKYKDDFSVTVNGKIYLIQRGITVMIPRHVLLAIEDSEVQRANAANTSQKYENLYTEKQDKF